jgi:hypothetical protein
VWGAGRRPSPPTGECPLLAGAKESSGRSVFYTAQPNKRMKLAWPVE